MTGAAPAAPMICLLIWEIAAAMRRFLFVPDNRRRECYIPVDTYG
jgi:hypothetical protein